jgi:UDP-N-acetylglucosamine 2-epimerase (non-hydrolysing)
MKVNQNTLYFMVGTEAELMKLFPVINAAKHDGFVCKLIVNDQNNIYNSPFLKLVDEDIFMNICQDAPGNKNGTGYIKWFIRTSLNGKKVMKDFFKDKDRDHNLIVVHGDTLTTAMGAWLSQQCNVPYVHIESGLRSYNFLSPFPEELDRLYGSLHSVINFCPKDEYANYASKRFKGKSVSTVYNTGMETLLWALEKNGNVAHSKQPIGKFFMFMLHRQENLKSAQFLRNMVNSIAELSKKIHCVFIYHEQTLLYMKSVGVINLLTDNPNVTVLPRQGYEDFIKLVKASEFVVTDGCGNQQEFYYMGKPFLIMRTSIEQDSEGIGWNAKPFGGDFSSVTRFYDEYHNYTKEPIHPEVVPSDIIVKELSCYFDDKLIKKKK